MTGVEVKTGIGGSLVGRAMAVAAVCVLVGVATLVAMQHAALRAASLEAGLVERQTTIALVADQMAGGAKWGRAEVVQQVADRLAAQSGADLSFVLAVDANGGVLASHPTSGIAAAVSAMAGEAPVGVATRNVDGLLLIAAPMGEFGTLVAAWDESVSNAVADARVVQSIGLGAVVALLLIGVIGLYLSRGVARPLNAVTAAVNRLAQGDSAVSAPGVERSDEVGVIARAVEQFRIAAIEKVEAERDAAQARQSAEVERTAIESVAAEAAADQQRVVDALAAALSKLAEGDVTYRVRDTFPSKYEKLKDDLNAAFSSLQEALGRITENAEAVRAAAVAIAEASDELSSRTESQAASLEESAAAIEEIAGTTRKTADGAAHARVIVARAKSEAEDGGSVVRDAVTAMSEIETSSEKIGQIIGVIDEIAFQTNLLALNAGVEAARAGEAGRGFAVVASEVRALAQRSADAAKQIKGLIMSSKEQVEQGVKLVDGAGSALERIISGVGEINDSVADIAASAQDQATGLQEVSGAVSQMDQITQQNAAMVEKVTASVRALSSQTDEFARLVGRFRTGVVAGAPRSAAKAAGVSPIRPATGKPIPAKPAAASPAAAKPVPAKPAPAKAAAPAPAPAKAAAAAPAPRRAASAPRAAASGSAAVATDAGWEEF